MVSANYIITRNNALKSKASNFRNLWEDCARYVMPRKGQITTQREEGNRASDSIFDTTAEESLLIFASGLLQHLTPPGQIWARIESSESEPSEELKQWFDKESEELMAELHSDNFQHTIHEAFLSLGAFGTCCVLLEEGTRDFLNFKEAVVGTFSLCESNEGDIDTVYREWKWSARQAEQEWGREALGPNVRKALESKNPSDQDKEFTFIHAVYPRRSVTAATVADRFIDASLPLDGSSPKGSEADEVIEGRPVAPERRPIASVYVCVEDKQVILEDGYYEMPYAACRLLKSNGETYGRGPSMQVLPNLRLINRMELGGLASLERAVDPSWLMSEDAQYRPDNRPGGITYWDATNPAGKPEMLQTTARIDLNESKLEQIRERISRAWHVPMFHALNNEFAQKRQKTAFEVEQMLQEKMADFSPMFTRITRELLGPLLERAFAMRLRSGRAEAPPIDIGQELSYKIRYTGEIALRIRAMQDKGTVQAAQLAGQFAQFDPSVLHVIKWQDRFREIAKNLGVPSTDIRSHEEVVEIMEAQAQAEAQAQEAQQMQQMAGAMKDMGQGAAAMGGVADSSIGDTLAGASSGAMAA